MRADHLRQILDRVEYAEEEIVRLTATRDLLRKRFGAEAARQRKAVGASLRTFAGDIGVSGQMLHTFERGHVWSVNVAHGVVRVLEQEAVASNNVSPLCR